jgi:hypothetical protein
MRPMFGAGKPTRKGLDRRSLEPAELCLQVRRDRKRHMLLSRRSDDSLPMSNAAPPHARIAPAPPLLPPGVRSWSQGLFVRP